METPVDELPIPLSQDESRRDPVRLAKNLGQRMPRGISLPSYGIEYFNQLVAYYLTLPYDPAAISPTDRNIREIADAILAAQKNRLNWGDLSGLEMALLRLLPEAVLERYAWVLRARYKAIAGLPWSSLYDASHPPVDQPAPPATTITLPMTTASGKASAAGGWALMLVPPDADGALGAPVPAAPPKGISVGVSTPAKDSAQELLRADLAVLLSELQRLRSLVLVKERKRSHLVGGLVLMTSIFFCLSLALYFFLSTLSGPVQSPENRSTTAATQVADILRRPIAHPGMKRALAPPTASRTAPATRPASAPPQTAAERNTLLDALRTILLVICCGVLGGLVSTLRRIQAVSLVNTPFTDTVELDFGQVGVFLSPLFGAVFAMALYLLFMGGFLDATVSGTHIFPTLDPATGNCVTDSDFSKLLVWSFIAGFAEKLVPDVLDRLAVKSDADALKAKSG